ncbi:MAG: DUF4040 domain-containing protein [Desulfobulbaceae bacterium]|nr:DUF4040 domain-containing protein [Desulfobulbaceae bacterium]
MHEPVFTKTMRFSLSAVPFLTLAALLALFVGNGPQLPLIFVSQWVPALGVQLAWRIDGLSVLMLFMITGVGSAVFVYANGYMRGNPQRMRMLVLLALFMAAMVFCVCADDLIVLFLGWEATSILSFLLVGFQYEKKTARKSAQQALLITGGGGLFLLIGFLLLAQQGESFSLSSLIQSLPDLPRTPQLYAAMGLILIGAFTKSAQFPFHFWLPNAMAAPTPVSAYLHSATMVKLGIYLLARFDAGLDSSYGWQLCLQTTGSITAAWGMVLVLKERDLKRILAWSTVATLGTLVAFVGLPGQHAAFAVAALLLAHALYKAPLFFVAGNIDKGVGTRIIDHLSGLGRAMPWTASAALLAGISMAGLPFSLGHVTKGLIGLAKETTTVLSIVPMTNLIFNAIAVGVATVAAVRLFWWHPVKTNELGTVQEGSFSMVTPPLVLAGCGIMCGIFPQSLKSLMDQAVQATLQQGALDSLPLQAVTDFDFPLLLMVLILGAIFFFLWDLLHRIVDAVVNPLLKHVGAATFYARALAALPGLAAGFTRRIQHGRLPGYLATILIFCTLILGYLLWQARLYIQQPPLSLNGSAWLAWGAATLIATGAITAATVKSRLTMVLAATLVGYGSALLFLFAGAPDVALTQFVVDTVFVVVVAAVLLTLTKISPAAVPEPGWRPGTFVLALAFATLITLLLMATLSQPFSSEIPDWFSAQSVPAAHGRNVVNVILVDFRAFDTLGEITVVLLSLVAALAVLGKSRGLKLSFPHLHQQNNTSPTASIVVEVAARYLYPLMIAVSLFILFRGHNEPGGGFIGGLLAATASVLWAIAKDVPASWQRMPLQTPLALSATGLGLAAFSGVPGWCAGKEYLTHLWFDLLLGWTTLPLSTTFLFDLGVYLCVWGAVGGYTLHLLAGGEPAENLVVERSAT